MKFDKFQEYKKLIESADYSISDSTPEFMKVYEWMVLNGNIEPLNEGLWNNVWGWIKKHFSPTAIILYKMAGEYAKELDQELRAEYGKTDTKNLAAKMRASYGAKLSSAIEEKMDLEAGDDEHYRELVRALITKKSYEVRKKILEEYEDRFEGFDAPRLKKELEDGFDEALSREDKVMAALSGAVESYKEVARLLSKKIESESNVYKPIIKGNLEKDHFVAAITAYTERLNKLESGKGFTPKIAIKNAEELLKNNIS